MICCSCCRAKKNILLLLVFFFYLLFWVGVCFFVVVVLFLFVAVLFSFFSDSPPPPPPPPPPPVVLFTSLSFSFPIYLSFPLPSLYSPPPINPFTPPHPTPHLQFRLFVVFAFRLVCSVTMAWSPDVTLTAFTSLCCRFDYNSITMAWTKVFLLGACVVLVAMATSKKRQSAPNLLDMQQQLANVLTALT